MITLKETKEVLKQAGYKRSPFDIHEIKMGLNVELEHSDITNGDLQLTLLIALAHLRENPHYYTILKQVGL